MRATIAEHRMLNFDDRVAVAVSGGKDSVGLLHILAKLERNYPRTSLVGLTVDEGILGYRDEALRIAAENCRGLEVEHRVFSFKRLFGFTLDEVVERSRRKADEVLSSCAYCGVLRRKALNLAAREVGADKLATAHTLDDEVQTVLLNLFHGDVFRLASVKPVTDRAHPKLVQKIKPFCEVPEKETALYAYVKQIAFQDVPCPFAADALRNDVRLLLNRVEEVRPGVKFTVFRSVEKLRPAVEETVRREGLRDCAVCGEPTTERVCRACALLRTLS